MEKRYITVSALNRYIKTKIDQDQHLQRVLIKGEISNCKNHSSGHLYFTLKDENARINAVMFASRAGKVPFVVSNGMKVLLEASVSVYDVAGTYQLYVTTMEQDGIGNLFLAFEKLKKELATQGLFEKEHKKKIPKFPTKIAVLSANKSAALMDIIRTIRLRFPVVKIVVFPIPVQGQGAYQTICKTLRYVDTLHFSTILLARGGGSLEDLWNFNEEALARTIYSLHTPIISGVGHEVDYTICDFVADARAATPTAAASLATPDMADLQQTVDRIRYNLQTYIKQKVELKRKALESYQSFYMFQNPEKLYIDKKAQSLVLEDQLKSIYFRYINQYKQKVQLTNQSFHHQTSLFILSQKNIIRQETKQLEQLITMRMDKDKNKQRTMQSQLLALSPLATLQRGYAIVKKEDTIIRQIGQLQKNDEVEIMVSDGTIKAIIK